MSTGKGVESSKEVTDLEALLDRVEAAERDHDRVSLRMIVDAVGSRSFAPLLLVAGLITVAPVIGDIPGVPTLMATFVLLIAGQMLFHRQHFWLPRHLLDRSVSRDTLDKALKWLRQPARFIDRLLRPRLTFFTQGAGSYAVAITCAVIAAVMPTMEVVPLVANAAGLALTAFGLALMANDGVLALFAFAVTFTTIGLVVYNLL